MRNALKLLCSALFVLTVLAPLPLAAQFRTYQMDPSNNRVYGINDRGDVVGAQGIHAFKVQGGSANTGGGSISLYDFPGAVFSYAVGISGNGNIVGNYADTVTQHCYTYDVKGYRSRDISTAQFTSCAGIQGNTIFGYFLDGSGSHGFYETGAGVVTQLDYPAAGLTDVQGMYGSGSSQLIYGTYVGGDCPLTECGFVYSAATSTFTSIQPNVLDLYGDAPCAVTGTSVTSTGAVYGTLAYRCGGPQVPYGGFVSDGKGGYRGYNYGAAGVYDVTRLWGMNKNDAKVGDTGFSVTPDTTLGYFDGQK